MKEEVSVWVSDFGTFRFSWQLGDIFSNWRNSTPTRYCPSLWRIFFCLLIYKWTRRKNMNRASIRTFVVRLPLTSHPHPMKNTENNFFITRKSLVQALKMRNVRSIHGEMVTLENGGAWFYAYRPVATATLLSRVALLIMAVYSLLWLPMKMFHCLSHQKIVVVVSFLCLYCHTQVL